jgi:hypothetical protein
MIDGQFRKLLSSENGKCNYGWYFLQLSSDPMWTIIPRVGAFYRSEDLRCCSNSEGLLPITHARCTEMDSHKFILFKGKEWRNQNMREFTVPYRQNDKRFNESRKSANISRELSHVRQNSRSKSGQLWFIWILLFSLISHQTGRAKEEKVSISGLSRICTGNQSFTLRGSRFSWWKFLLFPTNSIWIIVRCSFQSQPWLCLLHLSSSLT